MGNRHPVVHKDVPTKIDSHSLVSAASKGTVHREDTLLQEKETRLKEELKEALNANDTSKVLSLESRLKRMETQRNCIKTYLKNHSSVTTRSFHPTRDLTLGIANLRINDRYQNIGEAFRRREMKTLSVMMATVVTWKLDWFLQSDTPTSADSNALLPLLQSYDSYENYRDITGELQLLELLESLRGGRKENEIKYPPVTVKCRMKESSTKTLWCGMIPNNIWKEEKYPSRSDVVSLHSSRYGKVVGYISEAWVWENVRPIHQPYFMKLDEHGPHAVYLFLVIHHQENYYYSNDPSTILHIQVIGNVLTFERQYDALIAMKPPTTSFLTNILDPMKKFDIFGRKDRMIASGNSLQEAMLNPSQLEAVKTAAYIMDSWFGETRISLIQGPPGTGKTRVILEIIKKILRDKSSAKILVCAHSNGAVDEISRRLGKLQDGHPLLDIGSGIQISLKPSSSNQDENLPMNMIRLGRKDAIAQDVLEHTNLRKKNRELKWRRDAMYNQLCALARPIVEDLEKDNARLSQLKASEKDNVGLLQLKTSERDNKKFELEKIIKAINDRIYAPTILVTTTTVDKDSNLHDLFAMNVVCCTLSFSGSHQLQELKAKFGHHFDCVIIDEASQCTELDCLIPVSLGIKNLILVGDHEQLPPTILSRKAQEYNYGQSLFDRFINNFESLPLVEQPVLFLDTQYRMHREICAFPNKHIYMGRLKNHIDEQNQTDELHSYKVFDLQNTEEENDGEGNISNYREVGFVVSLALAICRHTRFTPSDIGVISPYTHHNGEIVINLKSTHVSRVEVNSVDGYQGREKPIIIFSCVRAKSKTIGFLSDRRRMNVALTRAKSCLYIIGNVETLQMDGNWRALIEDAQSRGQVIPVQSFQHQNEAIKKCLKCAVQSKRKPTQKSQHLNRAAQNSKVKSKGKKETQPEGRRQMTRASSEHHLQHLGSKNMDMERLPGNQISTPTSVLDVKGVGLATHHIETDDTPEPALPPVPDARSQSPPPGRPSAVTLLPSVDGWETAGE